jgi:hypothetical protein
MLLITSHLELTQDFKVVFTKISGSLAQRIYAKSTAVSVRMSAAFGVKSFDLDTRLGCDW